MRIGLDIDETMTNTDKFIDKLLKKVLKGNRKLIFEYENEISDCIKQNVDYIFANVKLKKNAKSTINYLKQQGHEIYIITARNNSVSESVEQTTLNYLREKQIEYDKIFFGCHDKKSICVENNVEIMLDDNIDIIHSLIGTETKGLLFESNKDYPYSAETISDWSNFKKYVDFGGYDGKKSIIKRRNTSRRF